MIYASADKYITSSKVPVNFNPGNNYKNTEDFNLEYKA